MQLILATFARVLVTDRNDPIYWIVRFVFFAGAIRTVVPWMLELRQQPDIQVAGRWLAKFVCRLVTKLQAELKVPDARRHRPIREMMSTLAMSTLNYMFALYFFLWFAWGILLLSEIWPLTTMSKGAGILAFELTMALLTRYYSEHGRRLRVKTGVRWRAVHDRRWLTGAALATVPAFITLIAVCTELLRRSN